ncbi:hypothetical protein W70_74 [Escherichia phage W70]|nr:hypothetical protein W70_74 [Escherichia phage W70]
MKNPDPCLPYEDKLYDGCLAMVHSHEDAGLSVKVKMVCKTTCLVETSSGSLCYYFKEHLMPLTVEGSDDSKDLDEFLYEARYGL